MPPLAELITYREVFRKEPTQEDLHAILKKYQRGEVILLLGKLNCLMGTWKNEPDEELDRKLSSYILDKHVARLNAIRKGRVMRLVFSRLTILYLVKQACLVCPKAGPDLTSAEGRNDLGVCCLMANDLVLPFMPKSTDSTVEKLANLLPFSDYMPMDHYPKELARTELILQSVLPLPSLKKRTNYIDLSKLFEDRFGFSAQSFCQMIFGCSTKPLQVTPEQLQSAPDALIIRDTFFSKTNLPGDVVEKFFKVATISADGLTDRIKAAESRPGDDLTIIQSFPLIEIVPQRYLCLDPGFLIEKAGRAFGWALLSKLSDKERRDILAFWGSVFEEYVNFIIQESYHGGGRFIPEVKFPNGDASFDCCIVEGRDLIVFEHKSSVIRADAKYGGDVAKLEGELRLKFIEGDPGEKKGLAQISNSIQRFLGGEDMDGISSREISRI